MIADSTERETRTAPPPPSPWGLFGWAAAWASVSALGWVVFVLRIDQVANFSFAGQRTWGIVVFTPSIALILAIVCVVRGLLALGPSREYTTRWSARERAEAERARLAGQPSTPFIVFAVGVAVIWAAGVTVVVISLPNLATSPEGLSLTLVLLALVAMLWISTLRAGIRRRRFAGAAS